MDKANLLSEMSCRLQALVRMPQSYMPSNPNGTKANQPKNAL